MSLRDRLASLSRAELLGLVAFLAVTLGGAGLWYLRSLPRPVEIGAPSPSVGASVVPVSTSPSPVTVVVDVAGWVKSPGVYELLDGQRVIDAIDAAGGPKRGSDLTSINLAALLQDGSEILVPKAGDSVAGAGSGAAGPGATPKVNVNTATETELEVLPDIGPVLAAAIIKYRTDNGPFTSVDELDNVSGIGPATLADLRDLVTV